MHTLFDLIEIKTETWISQEKKKSNSAIGYLINYIISQSKLREPQLKSIEVYLWLKFIGNNQKLSEIVKQGLLYDDEKAKEYKYYDNFKENYITQFLNQFSQDNDLKNLLDFLLNDPNGNYLNWENVLEDLLHNFNYPNYLFSLPMGAGKTFLMAAFIYIDLYFALINKEDNRFAHNFVVFAPSASKTAILPSLQTIKNFDPSWIIPKSDSERLKNIIHFEILDSLSSKRKDKLHGNNPNLEKVNRITSIQDFGAVFITNAEKVVLERYDEYQKKIKSGQISINGIEEEEFQKTNLLREKLSKIKNLTVILDEVHHTYGKSENGEKKLRQAVNILNQYNNVTTVLGFSGTPFVRSKVKIGKSEIKLNQIQDIVYNFSLADGIGKFLKIPEVVSFNIKEEIFLKKALDRFFNDFDLTYSNGTKSKIVFYCPSIKVLNQEILPVIQLWYSDNRPGRENEIFKYYSDVKKEDKIYKIPKESIAIFNNLDKPYSDKRVILLVAVGTEGWDCKSLTGVVLPRRDTTTNFVLQTTCRCLREVDNAQNEKALIYLDSSNYEILNSQLKENYNLSINDLKPKSYLNVPVTIRKPKLGKISYNQVYKKFTLISAKVNNPEEIFNNFDLEKFKKNYPHELIKRTAKIGKDGLSGQVSENINTKYFALNYSLDDLIYDIAKFSYLRLDENILYSKYFESVNKLYKEITNNTKWLANHTDKDIITKLIKSFVSNLMKNIKYKIEIIKEPVQIELLEWNIDNPEIFFGNGKFIPKIKRDSVFQLQKRPNRINEDFEDANIDSLDISFNYLPYRFDSDFEISAITEMLKLSELKNLEVYYNGYKDENLQNFVIKTDAGNYTPDFLIIKRKNGKKYEPKNNKDDIEKILIIETKGETYYNNEFKQKEKFVNSVFLKNNKNFLYKCFIDKDRNDFSVHLNELKNLINNL